MSNESIIEDMIKDFILVQRNGSDPGFEHRFYDSLVEDMEKIVDRFRIFAEARYDARLAEIRHKAITQELGDTILEWTFEEVMPKLIAAVYNIKHECLALHAKELMDATQEVKQYVDQRTARSDQ